MKTRKFLFFIIVFSFSSYVNSQGVSINEDGTGPDPSALLELKSSDKGLLLPRLTNTEIQQIIPPAEGLVVYNLTLNVPVYYDGSNWCYLDGTVLGGYDPVTWKRNLSTSQTIISGGGTLDGHLVTVKASSITSSTLFEGFVVYGTNTTNPTRNSYAMYVLSPGNSLEIKNNKIHSGNGATGTNGLNGGGNQCPPTYDTKGSGIDGFDGQSGDGSNGGAGGQGGTAGYDSKLDGTLCYVPSLYNWYGEDGLNGSEGLDGAGGPGGTNTGGTVTGGHWLASLGGSGTDGGNGGGGGGGGAGGGEAGTGGYGGGGSFGIFILNGMAPLVEGNSFYLGNGGNGGKGGNGGGGGGGCGGSAGMSGNLLHCSYH
ncbi:MAG: hypothetical protein K0B08_02795 [Bacteroidales bacterium]|nr:hypothetical protein [Bacteroidales bacterium]